MFRPSLSPTRHRLAVVCAGLASALLVSWLDVVTGMEVNLGFFYFINLAFVGWALGIPATLFFALFCALLRSLVDWASGEVHPNSAVLAWNTLMRVATFGFVGIALNRLRYALDLEKLARAAAQRAADDMASFLANISHEIRTPLNALIGMGDLLAETPLNRDQRQYVELCRREGEYLRHLVNDLLELSRLDAGQIRFERVSFSLHDFVADVISGLAPRAREKGLALTAEVAVGTGEYWLGDPFRLRQVLVNLLGNAIKFTTQGTVRLRTEAMAGGGLTFRVLDTGTGIPPERRRQIFERFVQGDDSTARQFGGAGLGLSICKGLVEGMGGRIWCESEPGRGSEFGFAVPLAPGLAVEKAEPPAAAAPSSSSVVPGPIRTLLAEDSAVNRLVLARLLPAPLFATDAVENGRQAVERFQSLAYDLVILDVNMPEMDGLAAARALRAWEQASGLRPAAVLALSASAFAEDRERCRNAGCTGFVAKPVRKSELLASIGQALGRDLSAANPPPVEGPPAGEMDAAASESRPAEKVSA